MVGATIRDAEQRMGIAGLRTAVVADHAALTERACAADATTAVTACLEPVLSVIGALIRHACE